MSAATLKVAPAPADTRAMTRPATVLVILVAVVALLETPVILAGPAVFIAAVVWLASRGRILSQPSTLRKDQPAPVRPPAPGEGTIMQRMAAEIEAGTR